MITKSKMQMTALSFRWLARLTSVLSIGTLGLFLFGEPFNAAGITAREWIGLAFFPVGVAVGMIVAWWKEGLGAAISLVSLLAFYAVYGWLLGSQVKGPWFVVFASPALLFLLTWLLSKPGLAEAIAES